MSGQAVTAHSPTQAQSRFVMRVFYVFLALAAFSVLISIAGRVLGSNLAQVGHTDDTRLVEAVVGNNVLYVPANYIRFEKQRVTGEARRLDLYLRWPDLAGYSNAARDDFNHQGGVRRVLFLSVEQQLMSRDMSARFDPIYSRLIDLPGVPAVAGLRSYQFKESSGYMSETLMVGGGANGRPFVARCLTGAVAAESLAPCERDVHFGDELSLTYRFPAELLGEWRALDAAVLGKMQAFLRTGQ
ncbi:MAG: hypothetical protein JJ969_08330 [Rhizobiaceae bacterium]|nr:hypothetical protein [Rhizobiaceae bacterium]